MQNPVTERIVKLPDELAQISEANRLPLHGGTKKPQAQRGSPMSASKIAGNSGRIIGADRREKAVKIANETCLHKWQGEQRNPHSAHPDTEIALHLKGTGLGGRPHRHRLTRIMGDQAVSGIGQPQGRGRCDE